MAPGVNICIETGTYLGENAALLSEYYEKVYTIELSGDLFRRAKKRLSRIENVECIHGDTAVVLPNLLSTVSESVCFYLDAHWFFSKIRGHLRRIIAKENPFPLHAELKAIASRQPPTVDIVIVDDVHLWGTMHVDAGWSKLSSRLLKRQMYPRTVLHTEFFKNQFVMLVQ